ncbi:hypothetical protein CLW00_1146 [Mongoliibacter ruber]|uniref:Uncharacterized protein n=1 Tax=Mongoliibacter ruber TaxID=1750599 RepID=A0A2T0WEF7_9BACT|nr:hypothetical protein CLW00_1146 [Mongoliibacter ruber]
MKKNSRREFLRSGSVLASVAAFSPFRLSYSNALLEVKFEGQTSHLQIVHTAGLHGTYTNPDQIGGLNPLGEYLKKLQTTPLFLDAGNFLNPDLSLDENLKFAKDLVSSGVKMVALGKSEMSFSNADLKFIISESGLKVIGNKLESKGLKKGESYFTKAIVQFGKYRIGVLSTQGLTLSKLNAYGMEMKLLHQCDALIGLGDVPINLSNKQNLRLDAFDHEVTHYLLGLTDQVGVGSRIIHSPSGKEVWISKPAEKAKLVSSFIYSMDKDYKINNLTNLSFVPGNASRDKMLAIQSGIYSTNQA